MWYYKRATDVHQARHLDDRELIATDSAATFNISYLKGKAILRHRHSFANETALLNFTRVGKHYFVRQKLTCDPNTPFKDVLAPIDGSGFDDLPLSEWEKLGCTRCSRADENEEAFLSKGPKLRAIDLFSGAGGSSVGYAEADFDIVAAVESDESAGRVFRSVLAPCFTLETPV